MFSFEKVDYQMYCARGEMTGHLLPGVILYGSLYITDLTVTKRLNSLCLVE